MEIMNLTAYLANIGVTLKEFSRQIDCSPTYLSNVINGRHTAGRRLSKDVYEATGGVIKLQTRLAKRHQKKDEPQDNQNQTASI